MPRHTDSDPSHKSPSVLDRLRTKPAAILLTTLGVTGLSACGASGESTPRGDHVVAVQAETKEAKADQVTFGIDASKFESNPDALVQEFYSQLNDFVIAGATHEAQDADRFYEVDLSTYVDELSEPVNDTFIKELFVDGWEDNDAIKEWIDTELAVAKRARELRMLSYTGVEEGGSFEPYYRKVVVDSIESTVTDANIVTDARWHELDNSDKTNVANNMDGPEVETFTGGSSIVWSNVNGKMKILDIAYLPD